MNPKKLVPFIVFPLVFLFFSGLEVSGKDIFLPLEGSPEIITREKGFSDYLLPLGKIVWGNLKHPEEEMPKYSVALQGIPLTGLAYIKPEKYLFREGEIEKITCSWGTDHSVEEVLGYFREESKKRDAEIFFTLKGDDLGDWATWHTGYYPSEERGRIIKGSRNHKFLAGKFEEDQQEKFFFLAVFEGGEGYTEKIFSQLDLIEPNYMDLIWEIKNTLPELMNYFGVPGVAIALVKSGELIWEKAFGFADLEREIPLELNHVFRVGSISKPVLAWGVMGLVKTGKINLEAPVEKYLSRWEIPESNFRSREVTIKRLLNHTGGFPGGIGGGFSPGEELPLLEDILSGKTRMSPAKITGEPGSGFLYSNPGYVLLELIVEEVSGRGFSEFMVEEVLIPLDMGKTTFSWRRDLQANMAAGYLLDGNPAPVEIDAAKGPGGLYSTTGDIATFLISGIPGGENQVLSEEGVNLLYSPEVKTTGFYGLISDHYGLGYYLETLPNGELGVSHGCQHTGWLANFFLVPETGDGIVILTNSERSQPLIAQILGIWAEKNGYDSVKMSRTYSIATNLIQTGILSVFLFSFLGIIFLGKGLVKKERHFAPFSRQNWFSRSLFSLGFVVLWGPLFWVTGQKMVRVFLPVLSPYLGVAFLFAGIPLLMGAVFPRREKRKNP